MAAWSDLCLDIVDQIVSNLSLPDRIRCRCVCVSWSKLITYRKIGPQTPWLMLPGDGNHSAKCFDPAENITYRIRFPSPMIRRRICIGSNHGWLITVDDHCDIQLVNPINGVQIQLPSVATLPYIEADRSGNKLKFHVNGRYSKRREYTGSVAWMHGFFFIKALLVLSDPTDSLGSKGFMVMLVHGSTMKLAYIRAGDKAWAPVALPGRYHVADIVFHEERFYTIDTTGVVKIWTENGLGFDNRTIHEFNKITTERFIDYRIYTKYLAVGLGGQLMLILRDRMTTTLGIIILVFNDEQEVWSHVDDLGDIVVFIGKNEAFCIDASVVPGLRRNCVYFTDDNYECIHARQHSKRDMGLFDMTDQKIKPMDGSFAPHLNWPPPIWFMPTLH